MEKFQGFLGGIISAGGASLSSLCCVLPVTIVLLGLGSGAFMAVTMKYTPVFVPIGVISVSAGFYLHFRERRRCAREGCRMAGSGWNLALLTLSAMVVATAVFIALVPGLASDLLMWATASRGEASPSMTDMPMGSTPEGGLR